jgi:CubicO group peptidase (beta-lactamase class C family)
MKYSIVLPIAILLCVTDSYCRGGETSPAKGGKGGIEIALAEQKEAIVTGKSGEAIDAYLLRINYQGSVLVYRNGVLVLAKGYGMANVREKIPNRYDSLFDIGSVSKQFTAAAILKLEMQGKLKTDDSIATLLGKVPEDKKAITIYHLLTHTSGIVDRMDYLKNITAGTRDELVAAVLGAKFKTEPGKIFKYTNVGYFLLAALVEIASGESYQEYLKKNIFAPAGMSTTGFCGDSSLDRTKVVHGHAFSQGNPQGKIKQGMCALDMPFNFGFRGASGIISNLGDMLRWHFALQGDKVLSRQAREKFITPFQSDYACGWRVKKTFRGTTLISHGGATRSQNFSLFKCYPDDDTVIIFLANFITHLQVPEREVTGIIFPLPDGFIVGMMAPGGNASKNGMQLGDVILSYNGSQIKNCNDLIKAIKSVKESNPIAIEIQRGKEKKTLTVHPGNLNITQKID